MWCEYSFFRLLFIYMYISVPSPHMCWSHIILYYVWGCRSLFRYIFTWDLFREIALTAPFQEEKKKKKTIHPLYVYIHIYKNRTTARDTRRRLWRWSWCRKTLVVAGGDDDSVARRWRRWGKGDFACDYVLRAHCNGAAVCALGRGGPGVAAREWPPVARVRATRRGAHRRGGGTWRARVRPKSAIPPAIVDAVATATTVIVVIGPAAPAIQYTRHRQNTSNFGRGSMRLPFAVDQCVVHVWYRIIIFGRRRRRRRNQSYYYYYRHGRVCHSRRQLFAVR